MRNFLGLVLGFVVSFSGINQAISDEDKTYQCLDAIEANERFEIHSHRLTNILYKSTSFEGKQMKWYEIENELRDANYLSFQDVSNPNPAQAREIQRRQAKAIRNPRIAKLAVKYNQEFKNLESPLRKKEFSYSQDLLGKTFTFHDARGGAHIITGNDYDRQRQDELSPVRPFGLLASRETSEGKFLYLLTAEGVRKAKITSNKVVVGMKRVKDEAERPFRPLGFPQASVFRIDGENVRYDFPSEDELKAAKLHFMDFRDNSADMAKKTGREFVAMDYSVLPLNDQIKQEAKEVFREELARIIKETITSHDNQMAFLKHMDSDTKDLIKLDWDLDEKGLGEIYTKRYVAALQKCAELDIGVSSEAATAVASIQSNQQKYFPEGNPEKVIPAARGKK